MRSLPTCLTPQSPRWRVATCCACMHLKSMLTVAMAPRQRFLLLAAAAAAAGSAEAEPAAGQQPPPPLFACGDTLAVSGLSADYSWTFRPWPSPTPPAVSGPYVLLLGGRWLSSADGSLVPAATTSGALGNGSDAHGRFTSLTLGWRPAAAAFVGGVGTTTAAAAPDDTAAAALWLTSFRCYEETPGSGRTAVVFSQHFPAGLHDAPGGPRDFQRPSSRFPSFRAASLAGRPMITFKDGNAGHTLHAGLFPGTYLGKHRQQTVHGGLGGFTSGPLLFGIDSKTLASGGCFVISPLNTFLAALHNIDGANDTLTLSFGVGGLMSKLPQGYTSEFVAVVHQPLDDSLAQPALGLLADRYSGSAARAFVSWGNFLLEEYGQERTRPDANAWISHLGYSTTGTFHYNPCDCPSNLNRSYCPGGNNSRMPGCHTYEDTLLHVQAYAKEAGIPYRWWLIDSWWHAFDNNTYFEDIPAQVGTLFPSGVLPTVYLY